MPSPALSFGYEAGQAERVNIFVGTSAAQDDVTYFAQIRGGGLDLVKWKLPHTHDQTMKEATTDERRYTGSAGSAAR